MSETITPGKTLDIKVTPVFLKVWDAINAVEPDPEDPAKTRRKYKYIILKGSSRSSKTWSIIDALDLYARRHRNKRLTVWRDTKVDCVDTVFNDIERRLLGTGRWQVGNKFNATKTYLRYDSSSRIEAHGADDSVAIHGLTQEVAWLNEPYKISKDVFDQIDQRTSEFILIDWNPRLAHWIEDLEKDTKTIVLHSTFKDNPFCPDAQRDKILSYQPVSASRIVKQKLLIERDAEVYDTVANKLGFEPRDLKELRRCQDNQYKNSASAYNWSVYGLGERAERPNRIYRWQEITLREYRDLNRPVYYYVDWGTVDPWAIGEVKYYDGAFYVRELNYKSENEIRDKLSDTERAQIGTDEDGLVSWLFNSLDIPPGADIICDSARPRKIRALRAAGFEYAIGVGKGPGSVVDGIAALTNLRVFYTSESANIAHEQENYSRKVDRYGIVLEEPEDFSNHHLDGIRYVALYLQDTGVISKI